MGSRDIAPCKVNAEKTSRRVERKSCSVLAVHNNAPGRLRFAQDRSLVFALPRPLARKCREGRPVEYEVEAHVSTFLTGGKVAEALSSWRISPALQQRFDVAVGAVLTNSQARARSGCSCVLAR